MLLVALVLVYSGHQESAAQAGATAGHDIIDVQSLTPSGGGTSPLKIFGDLKIFDGDLDLNGNLIRNVMKLGIGTNEVQGALHVATSDAGTSTPVSLLEHSISSVTDSLASVARLRTVTSIPMVDGFGGGLAFENKGATSDPFTIARIGAARDGADGHGALHFQTQTLPDGLTTKMAVRANGNVEMQRDLYIGNVDGAGEDTIYFDRDGSESLKWQNSQTLFMFSDEVWGTTFNPTSDRNLKEKFKDIDPVKVLDQVVALPITTWKFKEDDSAVRHIGPMGQDFHQIFAFGVDDRHISTTDLDGVALAAIQGLKRLLDDKERKIRDLERRLERLERSNRGNR
jgi:hypothetical protein